MPVGDGHALAIDGYVEEDLTITEGLRSLQKADRKRLFDVLDSVRCLDIDFEFYLPQLVVCGHQSSGKSTVLEAISGIPFPRADMACTRFVTEIEYQRGEVRYIEVEIAPDRRRPLGDQRRLSSAKFTAQDLTQLPLMIKEAEKTLGLSGNRGFARDVLKVRIRGPDYQPLILVDLPGLIESHPQQPEYVRLVEEVTDDRIAMKHSIILAVVDARSDPHTQRILTKVKEVDPYGERTLGIITKPDILQHDSLLERYWIDQARNIPDKAVEFSFKQRWHVLRSRNYSERQASTANRNATERQFFRDPKRNWHVIDRQYWGIVSLRKRLNTLLNEHAKKQLVSLAGHLPLKNGGVEVDRVISLLNSIQTESEEVESQEESLEESKEEVLGEWQEDWDHRGRGSPDHQKGTISSEKEIPKPFWKSANLSVQDKTDIPSQAQVAPVNDQGKETFSLLEEKEPNQWSLSNSLQEAEIVARLIVEMRRPLHPRDSQQGTVYVCIRRESPGMCQIGSTTVGVPFRLQQYEESCRYLPVPIGEWTMQNARRVETLASVDLSSQRRTESVCNGGKGCGKKHSKWFEISRAEARAVVERWRDWIDTNPYDGDGQINGFWNTAFAEAVKLQTLEAFRSGLRATAGLARATPPKALPFSYAHSIEELFVTCIQSFDLIQLGQEHSRDHTYLLAGLKVEKTMLLVWGASVGIEEARAVWGLPKCQKQSLEVAKDALNGIRIVFEETTDLESEFGLRKIAQPARRKPILPWEDAAAAASLNHTYRASSTFHWAIHDGAKCSRLIDKLREFRKQLKKISASFASLGELHPILQIGIRSTSDAEFLAILQDACLDEEISRAAVQQILFIENASRTTKAPSTAVDGLNIARQGEDSDSDSDSLSDKSSLASFPSSQTSVQGAFHAGIRVGKAPRQAQSAAEDEDADIDSIASVISDGSSMFSSQILQTSPVVESAKKELSALLIGNDVLAPLYKVAFNSMGSSKFERNFVRLLKRYHKDLKSGARGPLEQGVVRLLRLQTRHIARGICEFYNPVEDIKRRNLQDLMRQDADKLLLLEGFLESEDRVPPDLLLQHTSTAPEGDDQLYHHPDSDESSIEESELDINHFNFPMIEQLKSFLTSGTPFSTLQEDLCHFVSRAVDAKASSSQKVEITPKSKHQPSKQLRGAVEAKHAAWLFSLTEMSHSFCTWLKKALVEILRPSTKPGYKRITWICGCGKSMYTDVKDESVSGAETLQAVIRDYATAAAQTSQGQTSSPQTTTDTPSDIRPTLWQALAANNGDNSNQGVTPNRDTQKPTDCTVNRISRPPRVLVNETFLLTCVNTSRLVKLEQVLVMDMGNDQILFQDIRHAYLTARKARIESFHPDTPRLVREVSRHFSNVSGCIQRSVIWLFDKLQLRWLVWWIGDSIFYIPKCANFVRFELVPIKMDLCPEIIACPSLPSYEEVHFKKTYHYQPCIKDLKDDCLLRTPFLHVLFEPGIHLDKFWTNRLPKKLNAKLNYNSGIEPATGWGIHIIEGPNWIALCVVLELVLFTSFVLSITYSAVAKDVSSGFEIGSFVVAISTVAFAVVIGRLSQMS